MASDYESFWQFGRYAVVGHSAKRAFPRLTYGGLKARGKTVYAVDPSAEKIEGDPAYPDLGALPGEVDAVVLEVPREETRDWVKQAAEAGIQDLWMHMNTDTPEALAVARDAGIRARHGTCAVMYLKQGFTYHSIHRYINRWLGKY
jgi:predicted CoA-binding protein